jgi:hypothetical protein
MTDYFLRRGIHALASDLPEEEKARLRAEVRERHLSPQETLTLITKAAERYWHEAPSVLPVRGLREQANLEAAQRLLGEAP